VALVPPLDASADEVKDALAPLRSDCSIAVYASGNAFALGAIVRIAHNFLAREVIVIGDEPAYEKASMGMEKFESVIRVPDAAAFFDHVHGEANPRRDAPEQVNPRREAPEQVNPRREAPEQVIWAIEKDAARRSITSVVAFPPGVVFLFGSERFGIPPEVLAKCNDIVGIPIYGVNHSLPLAVAAGIVMHEHARRRFAPGTAL
jgi:tRNA G18 (ribose-2'-O)-methylase SpoU